MKKIGLIGAMTSEITRFCEDFCAIKTDVPGIWKGTLCDKEIYICESGVGKVNAAIAAQRLCDLFGVEAIINSGVAGGINEALSKCDIVISERLTYHDFDPISLLEKYPPYCEYTKADERLVALAEKACEELFEKEGIGYFKGTVVSGDCFVSSSAKVRELRERFDAYCTEMEGAAIAHTATVNKIPFVVIRAISDFADEAAEDSFESFEVKAARVAAYIVTGIIKEL